MDEEVLATMGSTKVIAITVTTGTIVTPEGVVPNRQLRAIRVESPRLKMRGRGDPRVVAGQIVVKVAGEVVTFDERAGLAKQHTLAQPLDLNAWTQDVQVGWRRIKK